MQIWTSGVTIVPKHDIDSRYTFFELDSKNIDNLHFVLDTYRANLGSCYVHETISGYHFYNFRRISKESYYRIIKLMKHLNPLCPLTVLRIEPNKWQNEARYWRKGEIVGSINQDTYELQWFKSMLESQNIQAIKDIYEVVRYPFEECPKCRLSNNVYMDIASSSFMCRLCKVQTIGRLRQKEHECYEKKLTDRQVGYFRALKDMERE